MLRRFAATAACMLFLDVSPGQAPEPGPSNASIVSSAMASRAPETGLLRLDTKYSTLPADRAAPEPPIDPGLDLRPAPLVRPVLPREVICNAIEMAALEHDIPLEFFGRLIWQESRLKPEAVSPAGARGIAQFMPATAADMGLHDPFDPVASLMKSAKFLRILHDKFGNLGLAAAAYNGGPGRVERWLTAWEQAAKTNPKPKAKAKAKVSAKTKKLHALPKETQDYVRIITGKPVTDWVGGGSKVVELKAKNKVPCIAPAKRS